MREDSIVRFLMLLGVERNRIETARDWVNCPCPMSPWTHKGGQDTRPSFGIRVDDSGPSFYYCFGCSPQGRKLIRLIHNMFVMSGHYPQRAAELYTWEEFHEQEDDDGIPEISTETLWSVPEVPVSPLPWEVINRYPLLQFGEDDVAQECRVYLELERGIDPWTANYFRVRYDPENATLIFPLTDSKGGIFLLRARSIYKKNIWTISPELAGYPNLIFPKLGEVGVWFGLWLVDWTRPVISVEAEMDVMKLASMGVLNSVASATSSVTGAQIDSLSPATRLYLGYDADKAGAHAHGRIYSRLSGGQRMKYIYELDWSVASACNDPGDLESEDDLKKVLDSRKLLDK